MTAPSDNDSDDEIGCQGLTPAEILSSAHPTVNNDPDVPNIAEQDSQMDLETTKILLQQQTHYPNRLIKIPLCSTRNGRRQSVVKCNQMTISPN